MPASRAPSEDGSGNSSELGASEPTISDNELLCQLQVGFRAELDIGSSRGERFLRQLAVGGVKSNLSTTQLNDALIESYVGIGGW